MALGRVETGLGPSGVSITRSGLPALVANRNAGTVGVHRIAGQAVSLAGDRRESGHEAPNGTWGQGVAFSTGRRCRHPHRPEIAAPDLA